MPSWLFAEAFSALEDAHAVTYLELEEDRAFSASTSSELKLQEYFGSPAQLSRRIGGIEVLVVHGAPVTQEVLDAGPELRLVCCARGGPVNVDVDAVTARGLPLVTTPGKNAEAVADLTLAFLVILARRLPRAQRFLEQGNQVRDNWDGAQFMGNDLRGQTLGLIGYGQIGRRVAGRAQAFGMEVLVYDPYLDEVDVEHVHALEELLARADFVSLHARATPDNARLIDASALARMKPGACLINTARETLLDEDALDAALAAGRLGGAALDVFERYTPGQAPRLLRHENVVLTPHVGGATRETLEQGARMIAAEIARLDAGEPLVNVFNGVAVSA